MNGYILTGMARAMRSQMVSKSHGQSDHRVSSDGRESQGQGSSGQSEDNDAVSLEIEKVKQSHKGAWA